MLAACFFLKEHALKGQVTKFSLGKRLLVYSFDLVLFLSLSKIFPVHTSCVMIF
jgi:hypothetical protein